MGFLSGLEALAGQSGLQVGDQAKVAGGLMQALEQHPGGVGGLLDSLRGNGLNEHVQAWANGQPATATPEQVQQGLGGTGLIERTAEKAGVSPQVVTMAMTTVLPMVIQHFAGGGTAAPQSEFGGLAQQLLSRLL